MSLRFWYVLFSGVSIQAQVLRASQRRISNCTDVSGWEDSEGYTCAEYESKSLCTSEGLPGPGWNPKDGGLEDLWKNGFSAQAACCTCGGGKVDHITGIWKVLRGNCTVEGSCILSPNYPSNYSTSDFCVILVNSSLVGPLETITWDVEWWYDYLKINDKLFNGRLQPDGIIPNGSIHWVSDDNNTGSGWKICSGNASKETATLPGSTSTSSVSIFTNTTVSTSTAPASASTTSSMTTTPSTTASNSNSTTTSSPSSSSSTVATTEATSVMSTTSTTSTTSTSTLQCTDVPGWEDSAEFPCRDYEERMWCTLNGEAGSNWNPMWGGVEEYWNQGFSALEACCVCGGGKIKSIPDLWMILSGPCNIRDGCIQSPNYPENYSNNQRCTILVNETLAKPIEVVSFNTEYGYDKMHINGRPFSGRRNPSKIVPHYAISWESDEDTTDKGWKLCPGQHPRGPAMFTVDGPCQVDAAGCAMSPNYPDRYSPNQDCTIQVFNPENKSVVVEQFSTEMLYDVMWFNARVYAGTSSPHGLVPTEAIQWSTDEDTEDIGWKICPGPVGQQVTSIGGLDPEEGAAGPDDDDETATTSRASQQSTAGSYSAGEVDLEEKSSEGSSNFIFKVGLAIVAFGLAGVLCLRLRRRKDGREEYGTRYGRSYAMDNL